MRTRCTIVGLAAAATLWTAADRRDPQFSVLIVTLDTTRADRLSPYGLMESAMPSFDRMASEATVFDQAASASPLTLPSHASIFTGLLPPRHGVRDNVDAPLSPSHTTLPEVLKSHGFRTAGFAASIVLDAGRGLDQGFEIYKGVSQDDSNAPHRLQKRADQVVDEATAWLRTLRNERFFLWTHLYDPHRPYEPPVPHADGDPYTGEIAYAASQFERLLEALRASKRLDRTIIIVTADHGESLGEHGESDHGIFLYEGVLRVPLMVRVPGMKPGRVAELVRLTDIMPTVLELLGLPPVATDGVSLASVVNGESARPDLESYSESLYPERFGWSSIYALRDSRFKYIDAPKPELYDLATDPFERVNIVLERPALASAMEQRVREIASSRPAVTTAERAVRHLTEDARTRLAALGYAAGDPIRQSRESRRLPDPKDCIWMRTAAAGTALPLPPCWSASRDQRD